MPLLKNGEVVGDRWSLVPEDADEMPTGDIMVSLAQWESHNSKPNTVYTNQSFILLRHSHLASTQFYMYFA